MFHYSTFIDNLDYLRIRNFFGTLGCLLPFLSIGSALFSPNKIYPDWWTCISVNVTRWVHYSAAFLLFLMLALNSIFLFSKSSNKIKNRIYITCGIVILAAFALFGLNAAFFDIKWTVIVNETIMLLAFGISWLVKGHVFDKWLGE